MLGKDVESATEDEFLGPFDVELDEIDAFQVQLGGDGVERGCLDIFKTHTLCTAERERLFLAAVMVKPGRADAIGNRLLPHGDMICVIQTDRSCERRKT